MYLVNNYGQSWPQNLTTEASFFNIKISLKEYTIPSLFQWKADNKSRLAIRLLQVHLPPRTELGKTFWVSIRGQISGQASSTSGKREANASLESLCSLQAGYSYDAL